MRNKLIFFLISINQIITYFEESHMKGTMLKVGLGQLKSVETHLPFKYDYLKLCNPENPRIINDNFLWVIFCQSHRHKGISKRTCASRNKNS